MTRRLAGVLAPFVLFLAACGGGDESADESAAPTTTEAPSEEQATPAPTEEATQTTEAQIAPEPVGEEGVGTAMVGDQTWQFSLTGDPREMCNPDMGGLLVIVMFGSDENGDPTTLSIADPGGGAAVVQIGSVAIEGELWVANPEVYADYGEVDLPDGIGAEIERGGNMFSGTATFYEDRALSATRLGATYESGVLDGSFQVTCPAS